ncbi:hypothetical protein CBS101457_000121 [Exobasidium rhododendri]|nr:hypothetical protein CBS101457_000121 [Exobasidium rhododendri]
MEQLSASYTQAMSLGPAEQGFVPRQTHRERLQAHSIFLKQYFAQLVEQFQQNLPNENQPVYVRPFEYRLKVDQHIHFDDYGQTGYQALSSHQGLFITERIREIRPYSAAAVHTKLWRTMRGTRILEAILGDNVTTMEAAINEVYKIDTYKRGSTVTPWMTGLKNEQRRQVINVLADAMNVGEDVLRDAFLLQHVPPSVASDVLGANNKEERLYAARTIRIGPASDAFAAWNKGLSGIQRVALLQRMMNILDAPEASCRALLSRQYVPEGLGKVLIRARKEEFRQIMSVWKNKELPVTDEEEV